MFSRTSKPTVKPDKPAAAPATDKSASPPSIISADLRIVGDLSCDGEIHVDGTVDGDVRAHELLIGETANIKGEVVVESVRVHGRVTGLIKARTVHLAKTAHVVGDIMHEELSIETGAFLEGLCKRTTVAELKEASAPKTPPLGKPEGDKKEPGPPGQSGKVVLNTV